ncbi:hypothetical protein BH11BAC1_BH11BAC1_27280 [soil metagenome]
MRNKRNYFFYTKESITLFTYKEYLNILVNSIGSVANCAFCAAGNLMLTTPIDNSFTAEEKRSFFEKTEVKVVNLTAEVLRVIGE